MNSYAYGYEIFFNPVENKTVPYGINITQKQSLSKKDYDVCTNFDTNQEREIALFTKEKLEDNLILNSWFFDVKEVVLFFIDHNNATIYYKESELYTDELMKYWLFHIVLPIYLTFKDQYYLLHAGSVEINNSAVLFMGNSYAGKSTLTDYFLKKNHSLISDDKLATFVKNGSYCVNSSHTYHRPFRSAETLGVKAENFKPKTYPIGKIYWIEPVDKNADISIEKVSGIEKFTLFRYATEMDLIVNQSKRFRYVTDLANKIDIFKLSVPRDLERLEEVYETIISHQSSPQRI